MFQFQSLYNFGKYVCDQDERKKFKHISGRVLDLKKEKIGYEPQTNNCPRERKKKPLVSLSGPSVEDTKIQLQQY